ncbi:MAG TPA: hypothetical protein VIL86_12910 [Tepidisphaeraceae bacterium]|jgi:hypothetical protein
MLVNEFDDLMEAIPFQPFRVYTADGRSVLVKSRQFAWHAPAHRTVFIASGSGDSRVHIIDLHLVSRFTIRTGEKPNGNGKRGGGKGRRQ